MDDSNLHRYYTKEELISLAELFGLDTGGNTRELVGRILSDLQANGVPDEDDECVDDLVYNFLCDAGYYDCGDAEGEVETGIEELMEEEESEEVDYVEKPEEEEETIEPPDCYGFADERDKACRACKIMSACMKYRKQVRAELPCYGIMFDGHSEECKACLEAGPCRTETIALVKIG